MKNMSSSWIWWQQHVSKRLECFLFWFNILAHEIHAFFFYMIHCVPTFLKLGVYLSYSGITTVLWFYIMKTAKTSSGQKSSFQLPFSAFMNVIVLVIEFSFTCGWLHISWGCMYAFLRENKKASQCHDPILREPFSTCWLNNTPTRRHAFCKKALEKAALQGLGAEK